LKVESITILHYGLDYLPFALKSVYDQVDRLHVVYTPHPSHGHKTDAACPETEDELKEAALSVGPKVEWTKVERFWREGEHRDYALSLCGDADVALVVDADEVWDPDVLERALAAVWDGSAGTWRLEFRTPWRSFNWLCTDHMKPDRLRDQRPGRRDEFGYLPPEWDVWHFGYAVPSEILRYKMKIHGHLNEWRPGWYEEKWEPWPPVDDVHPTCKDTWHPAPFDKERLPGLMKLHEFWSLEKIE